MLFTYMYIHVFSRKERRNVVFSDMQHSAKQDTTLPSRINGAEIVQIVYFDAVCEMQKCEQKRIQKCSHLLHRNVYILFAYIKKM